MVRRIAIALAVALAGAGASLPLSDWVAETGRQGLRAAARDDMARVSRAMADALDEGMGDHWRTIQDLAAQDREIPGEDAAATRRATVNALKGNNPDWAWIGFADTEGQVTASTDGILEGTSVASRAWFQVGQSAPTVLDVHEALLLARYLKADPASPPRLLDIATPLRSADGTSRGVLGSHLSWAWAKGVERRVAASLPEARGAEILVLASSNEVLLRPASSQERTLEVPEDGLADASGRITVAARTHGRQGYPGLGWVAVARKPDALVVAPAGSTRVLALVAGLIGSLVLGGLAFIASAPRPKA